MSEQDSDIEEENEEEDWVVGSREPTALDFTADRGLNADLPDSPPSSIDYFYLLFPEHLLKQYKTDQKICQRSHCFSARKRWFAIKLASQDLA